MQARSQSLRHSSAQVIITVVGSNDGPGECSFVLSNIVISFRIRQ